MNKCTWIMNLYFSREFTYFSCVIMFDWCFFGPVHPVSSSLVELSCLCFWVKFGMPSCLKSLLNRRQDSREVAMGKSKSREKPRYRSTLKISWGLAPSNWARGRVLLGIIGEGVPPDSPILIQTRFQTKKCHFPAPFSDQTSKIHTRFQTWPLGTNYVIIT